VRKRAIDAPAFHLDPTMHRSLSITYVLIIDTTRVSDFYSEKTARAACVRGVVTTIRGRNRGVQYQRAPVILIKGRQRFSTGMQSRSIEQGRSHRSRNERMRATDRQRVIHQRGC
jgi:hypothetical protein